MERLDVASEGSHERIALQRSLRLLGHGSSARALQRVCDRDRERRPDVAASVQRPGAALRPIAVDPPKRSMSAWRMLASFARESPQRASPAAAGA